MAKFITLGCYTAKGLAGFVSNPGTDRKAMQDAGYKNGDPLGGEMFPTLYEAT